ncbi:hypothetical protein [Streptomyces virginiae]|nr:hypothetical protein [Streptomyces virginiae]MCX5278416.1 hypothetical protein [Streptomyces virginiae]
MAATAARHTAPVCHGRRMRLDSNRQYTCRRCGSWTIRLLALLGGAR